MTQPPTIDESHQNGLWSRIVGRQVRYSRLLLAAIIAITIAAHWPASRLELDQSIESMFSEDDPVLQAFLRSRAAFGGDEFIFVAYSAPDLYEPPTREETGGEENESDDDDDGGESRPNVNVDRLEEIKAFANRLGAIAGIEAKSTQDLGHMLRPDGDDLPRGIRLMLRLPTITEKAMSFAEAVLVSPDRETVGIALRLDPATPDPQLRSKTIADVREMAAAHDPPAIVVGEPVQLADTFRYIEEDGALLGRSSALLLSVVIACLFRRLRWVLLPLAIVYSSLVLTEAALVLSGMRLSMVSSVLSALVTVIGIATTMHLIVHYRSLRRQVADDGPASDDQSVLSHRAARERDVRETFRVLGPPVFWTCLTTALGFLALTSSSILPVRSFGVMMAIGTGMVFVTTMTILPGGMLLGRESMVVKTYSIDRMTVAFLEYLTAHLRRFGWYWLGGTVVVAVVATVGLFRLKVETDFSKNFRESSPIVRALEFFENEMGGAGSWELLIDAPDEFNDDLVDMVRELAVDLRDVETPGGARMTKVVAVTDGLDLIPSIASRIARQSKFDILSQFQPEFVPSLYNAEQEVVRIVLRSNEREAAEEKLALIAEAKRLAQKYDADAQPTGTFLLLALLVDSLLADQWTSFALATGAIAIAMTVAFLSVRYGLISLVPNVFPIALVLGVIGWTGVAVNMGTAMIASVSVGLTVDSSIHYLAAYRNARRSGRSHWAALRIVHASTGRALVYSHIALVGGFSVLILSNFVPLIYFGVLVSVAMFVGLFGNLVVLPMLLTLVEPNTEPAVVETVD